MDATLGDVLKQPQRYPSDAWLYISYDDPWTLESKVLVLRDGESASRTAERAGMKQALTIDAMQQIRMNATMQVRAPSLDVLFEAFLFYYDNDAFIDLGKDEEQVGESHGAG